MLPPGKSAGSIPTTGFRGLIDHGLIHHTNNSTLLELFAKWFTSEIF
jgi:hypothetical protein